MRPLSIIIPTLNEEHYLPRLLTSIVIASKKYEGAVQIVVVDGASTDETVKVAGSFRGELRDLEVHSSERGISTQRNFGASKAKYETIIFLDADMECTENTLVSINAKLRNKSDFIAMPLMYPYDGKPIDFILGAISYFYFFVVQRLSPVISGMCIITTHSVHDRIGGFDERIVRGEDIDYGLRAVKSGAKHYVFLGARVRSSARRLDRDGRMRTALTWLRWHRLARRNRESLYETDDYEFGKFNKS